MKNRMKIMLAVLTVGVAGGIIVYNITSTGQKQVTQFERPDYGQADAVHEVDAIVGESRYSVEIEVPARRIPDDKLQEYFDLAYEYVADNLKGENESLDNVTQNLNMIDRIEQYGMTVEYYTDNYDLINCFGEVNTSFAGKDGTDVVIQIEIQYRDVSQMYAAKARVFPVEESASEKLTNEIHNDITEQNPDSSVVELPEVVDGSSVKYYEPQAGYAAALVFAGIFAAVAVYYIKKVKPRKIMKSKENQMDMDYSDIVSQLSLLMGAGMSGAGAFSRIASDYADARRQNKTDVRYAYEEIVAASNRIATGVSESDAYAAFGRACRTHSYVKLGNLMSQNVRKGGEYFMQMLREEVGEAFAQRKALACKRGEEAGTKLLLPMIMMLGIVLIIIVVPAFMSF